METVPSLYVFECVELELTFKCAVVEDKEPVESDFTSPMRLHRGEIVSAFPLSQNLEQLMIVTCHPCLIFKHVLKLLF